MTMPIHRRDFMKLLGVSVASLYLARCRPQSLQTVEPIETEAYTCYEAPPPTDLPTPEPTISSARERLHVYWLRFDELAKRSPEDTENKLGGELIVGHRATLDEVVASGEISAPVADLVHEAYDAAVYHVWRSNASITCYEPVIVDYAPTSAGVLVEQSEVLNQVAAQGTIDPETLAKAQAALEHDMAFYALTDEEVQALHDQLIKNSQEAGQPIPSFEELSLELTPEAKEATQFIINLLTGK
jgi:hypothetical protein